VSAAGAMRRMEGLRGTAHKMGAISMAAWPCMLACRHARTTPRSRPGPRGAAPAEEAAGWGWGAAGWEAAGWGAAGWGTAG
jgi:hypothetical protein